MRKRKDDIERELFGTRVDTEIIWKIKKIAVDRREQIYVIVEEAFKEYIKNHKERSK